MIIQTDIADNFQQFELYSQNFQLNCDEKYIFWNKDFIELS